MTVREDLENRIAEYEAQNTVIGDAMAIVCRSAMMRIPEDTLESEIDED